MPLDLDSPEVLEALKPLPPILYHYTNAAGFFGIVESGSCLHATHHGLVNDDGEISFGYDIAREVLSDLVGLAPEVREAAEAEISKLSEEDSFIACLSRKRNALSQWRAYGDNGAGYCIGFGMGSTQRLDRYGDDEDFWSTHVFECTYGRDAVAALLKQRFERCINREERAEDLASVAWHYAHLAKHEHFYEECEWRFVIGAPKQSVQYKVGARGLTPYLPTEKLTIEKVWIGPSVPGPRVAQRNVERFLASCGVNASVAHWESPFRR